MPDDVQPPTTVSRKPRSPNRTFKPEASLISGDSSLLDQLELIQEEDASGPMALGDSTIQEIICCVAAWLDTSLVRGLSPEDMSQLGIKLQRFPGGQSFAVDA